MSSENISYKGFWWLPSKPDVKVPGELFIDDNNEAILNLQRQKPLAAPMQIHEDSGISTLPTTHIILGLTQTGEKITLAESIPTNASSHDESFDFSSHLTYLGCHFQSKDEITFNSISIFYAHLDLWLERSGFRNSGLWNEGEKTLKYDDLEPIKVTVDDYEISIITIMSYGSEMTHQRKKFDFIEKSRIKFSFQQEKTLSEFLDFARHFQNFLTLALGKPTFPMEIRGTTEKCKITNSLGESFPSSIKIYQQLPRWEMEVEKIPMYQMPFTFRKVEVRWQEYITNWFQKASNLRPVYELFFATLYNPNLYLEGQFLNYVQALEAYHRRCGRFGGKYQSDEDYKTLYEKFVAVIPQDLCNDFKLSLKKGKLKYANEYSLRKRLKDLFMEILGKDNIPLKPFIIELDETQSQATPVDFSEKGVIDISPSTFFKPKPSYETDKGKLNRFIEEVCDYRNYLAHSSEELETKKVSAYQLIDITRQLKIILEICLLREIGFDPDSVYKIINRQAFLLL
jgi:hypothetical protein